MRLHRILLRKWRPLNVYADDDWAVKSQIVVPKSFRGQILQTARENPSAGHMGINKTYKWILNHFHWQHFVSATSIRWWENQDLTISNAPLQPIAAAQELFSRVIIDCVGPLPKTEAWETMMAEHHVCIDQILSYQTKARILCLVSSNNLCRSSESLNTSPLSGIHKIKA